MPFKNKSWTVWLLLYDLNVAGLKPSRYNKKNILLLEVFVFTYYTITKQIIYND